MIPQVAKSAGRLHVFQRSAIWVLPKPDFAIPHLVRSVFRRFPYTMRMARDSVAWLVGYGLYAATVQSARHPLLHQIPEAVGRAFLRLQVRDRALRAKLIPTYRFGCKRPSVSNIYYSTFVKPHVELVTDSIERITDRGIITADGQERELDVLILATGFQTCSNPDVYRRRPVTGRDGFDLADAYENNPLQAYEGVSLPQLPNTFMVFGPFSWSGGSWHEMVENQMLHTVRVLTEARRRGATTVSVTPEANQRFFTFIREKAAGSLITTSCGGTGTYYLDHHGEFSILRPTTPAQARHAAGTFCLDDYTYETRPAVCPTAPTHETGT